MGPAVGFDRVGAGDSLPFVFAFSYDSFEASRAHDPDTWVQSILVAVGSEEDRVVADRGVGPHPGLEGEFFAAAELFGKIGRESCRERVVVLVDAAVVAS